MAVNNMAYVSQRSSPRPDQNRLLAALEQQTLDRLRPHLEHFAFPLGKVLYKPGEILHQVYFPVDAIVSLLCVTKDGHSAETSVIGNEGMAGIELFMGGESGPHRAFVQKAGGTWSLPSGILNEEFSRHGDLMHLVLRYTQAQITQMAQIAVCNRHHSLDQQLCRWLLMSMDRLSDNRLLITQELMATMLGVRREGVTEAAGNLQKRGAIAYSRGKLEVLDRTILEALCCECYAVVKKETDRLLDYRARS